jgi:MFS family permease
MQIVLFLVFGTINALIASKKGFNPFIWFFAAGLLGLIVLAFLPSANAVLAENKELYEERKKAGNRAGIIILCIAAVLGLFLFLWIQSL